MFYHSLVCINHWMVPDHESECHENCILLDQVPPERRQTDLPCHFIPLNAAGETVASLAGDRERMEREVKQWLRATIARLKQSRELGDLPDVSY